MGVQRRMRLVSAALVLSLMASGCGSDDKSSSASSIEAASTTAAVTSGGSETTAGSETTQAATESSTATTEAAPDTTAAPTSTTEEPQFGGSITISTGNFQLMGLDPALAIATGCCGGNEMMLIYDTLMTYNQQTAGFEPNTAESLIPNDDFTEWTLKLRPDLVFPDGTPYDAEAVVLNVERHRTSPTSQEYPMLSNLVDTITVVDPLTVLFKMKQSWGNFPVSLSAGAGMIVSPKALADKGDTFNVDPGDAGIGPFRVDSFTPGESLVLKKKDDYWGGDVYLDEITTVLVSPSDAQVQALETGTLQGAMVMTPDVLQQAEDDGLQIVNFPYPAGNMTVLNSGQARCNAGAPAKYCEGKADGTIVDIDTPTKDVRVRRAIAMATDRDAINERVYGGALETYDTFIPPGHRLDPGVDGIPYDPEGAKALVEEVKAETGWDGSIRLVTGVASTFSVNLLQLYKTMLDAVGFNASIETDKTLAQVQIDKDYDVYPALGFGTSEDRLFEGLYGNLRNYRYGYSTPEMDTAIAAGIAAGTDEDRIAALTTVQELLNSDVPSIPVGTAHRNFVYTPKLHGVKGTAFQIVDLRKAWLEQ